MKISEWLPMSVTEGPPLPKKLNIRWPFTRGKGIEFMPALVLSADRARANPCKCFEDPVTQKTHCWSKGSIGLLTQRQQEELCVAGKTMGAGAGVVKRWQKLRG